MMRKQIRPSCTNINIRTDRQTLPAPKHSHYWEFQPLRNNTATGNNGIQMDRYIDRWIYIDLYSTILQSIFTYGIWAWYYTPRNTPKNMYTYTVHTSSTFIACQAHAIGKLKYSLFDLLVTLSFYPSAPFLFFYKCTSIFQICVHFFNCPQIE